MMQTKGAVVVSFYDSGVAGPEKKLSRESVSRDADLFEP